MYTKQPELMSARDFSTKCYRQDLAKSEQEVCICLIAVVLSCCSAPKSILMQGIQCTRWRRAGKNPGSVYWLQPGATISSKSSVMFSGLHSLQQTLYYELPKSAFAILVAAADRHMVLQCQGRDACQSLRIAFDEIS